MAAIRPACRLSTARSSTRFLARPHHSFAPVTFDPGLFFCGSTRTSPLPPSTSITIPSRRALVAIFVPTTAGRRNSRATIAAFATFAVVVPRSMAARISALSSGWMASFFCRRIYKSLLPKNGDSIKYEVDAYNTEISFSKKCANNIFSPNSFAKNVTGIFLRCSVRHELTPNKITLWPYFSRFPS